eukprot:CCRYP_002086-RA/>CCRYP_002086-RA protein AED:0.48 eAED:0.49 QI:0/-1/0/1/-1/1/1/0/72
MEHKEVEANSHVCRVSIADANTGDQTHNAGNSKPTKPQGQQLGILLLSAGPTRPNDGVWGSKSTLKYGNQEK